VAEVEATEAALRRQLELLADRNYRDAEPRFEFSDLGVTGLSVSFDDSAETGAPGVGPIPRAAQPLSVLIEQLRARRNATSLRTKPELNLEVSAGLYGGDDTFGESFFLDSPDASIGLVGRIPLDHPGVDAERRLFDAQIAQLSADIGRVQREVASAAGGLVTQLERLQGVIELSEAQLETALEKTEEEQLLYRQARVPLTTVIESQDEEQRIRLAVLQARARYHALAIQYRSLTDRLLQ
jgi:outer membrane protein TolC